MTKVLSAIGVSAVLLIASAAAVTTGSTKADEGCKACCGDNCQACCGDNCGACCGAASAK